MRTFDASIDGQVVAEITAHDHLSARMVLFYDMYEASEWTKWPFQGIAEFVSWEARSRAALTLRPIHITETGKETARG